MSSPTQTCQVCGSVEVVKLDGRGFPPDIAKRKLVKRCKANGHVCDPTYRAGLQIGPRPRGMETDGNLPDGRFSDDIPVKWKDE